MQKAVAAIIQAPRYTRNTCDRASDAQQILDMTDWLAMQSFVPRPGHVYSMLDYASTWLPLQPAMNLSCTAAAWRRGLAGGPRDKLSSPHARRLG